MKVISTTTIGYRLINEYSFSYFDLISFIILCWYLFINEVYAFSFSILLHKVLLCDTIMNRILMTWKDDTLLFSETDVTFLLEHYNRDETRKKWEKRQTYERGTRCGQRDSSNSDPKLLWIGFYPFGNHPSIIQTLIETKIPLTISAKRAIRELEALYYFS